ncbi:MAG: methyltransferase domain-containing protein [Desulfobacterales bacterium]|nr:methyltransferase domain-containing protein [Desulfobacterales bacterium]
MNTQGERIQDQFTKQSYLFQESHKSAADAILQAISVSGVTDRDTVLDVACGPGVLSCAFAKHARHVTGIDITPSMLEQAKKLQASFRISSHTKALTAEGVSEIMTDQGLLVERRHLYAWQVTADSLLSRSFPSDGDRKKIHRKYESDVGKDRKK